MDKTAKLLREVRAWRGEAIVKMDDMRVDGNPPIGPMLQPFTYAQAEVDCYSVIASRLEQLSA